MNKKLIRDFMTVSPHTIGADQELSKALEKMKSFQIRHLPVLKEKKVMGIVSDRDINLSYSLFSFGQFEHVTMEDICTRDPFTVSPEASLEQVVSTMQKRKIGSVIVVENDKVVGIFTDVDACRVLAEMLSSSTEREESTNTCSLR